MPGPRGDRGADVVCVILAIVEHPELANRTLAAAGCLSQLMGHARIDVLGIRTPPEATIMPSEEVLTRSQERQIREREERRLAGLRRVFDAWAGKVQSATMQLKWFDVEGLPDVVVQEWGRRADVIVLKRPSGPDRVSERGAIHAALFETDRPVLVVPPERAPSSFGRRLAIAWRDDKFTIRAVLAALRFATQADHVFILAGVRQGTPAPAIPDIFIEHGVEAELLLLPIGSQPFGEALLAKAHELGADMLVLGAFVHNPARRLILGGVTRTILERADLPVLMRH
ncbi:MAG: universal stress protein [Acetobacteraceae bacterium]|nr:universal stress protein [Acetobacteraceae bacterium]